MLIHAGHHPHHRLASGGRGEPGKADEGWIGPFNLNAGLPRLKEGLIHQVGGGNGIMYSSHIYPWKSNWQGNTLQIGASIGIVEINAGTEGVAALLSAADMACYSAKDGGRKGSEDYDRAYRDQTLKPGDRGRTHANSSVMTSLRLWPASAIRASESAMRCARAASCWQTG